MYNMELYLQHGFRTWGEPEEMKALSPTYILMSLLSPFSPTTDPTGMEYVSYSY